jgi:hypothetical protein
LQLFLALLMLLFLIFDDRMQRKIEQQQGTTKMTMQAGELERQLMMD